VAGLPSLVRRCAPENAVMESVMQLLMEADVEGLIGTEHDTGTR
jgi:hypothetical protein